MKFKKKVISTISVILFSLIAFSQNNTSGSVIYGKQILLGLDNKVPDIIKEGIEKAKGDTDLEYKLKFNNGEANFNIIKSMEVESNNEFDMTKAIGGGNGLFYYNSNTKLKLKQLEISDERFLITNYLDSLKWTITKDTMTIGGFLCYKAVAQKVTKRKTNTTRKVIAWFSMGLPISYGPIGYNGLPGLILDLSIENKVRFYAKIITLSKKEDIIQPEKGKKMTEEAFEIMGKKRYEAFKESRRRRN